MRLYILFLADGRDIATVGTSEADAIDRWYRRACWHPIGQDDTVLLATLHNCYY